MTTKADGGAREDMSLPAGLTCNDCAHVRRCVAFGFSWPARTSCDFYPVRFASVEPARPAPPSAAIALSGRGDK